MSSQLEDILRAVLGNQQVVYLLALIGANLILGIVASIKARDFRLTALADWLTGRVIPLVGGYAAAALLAYANVQLVPVREAAFYTLTLALVGYVFANLKDLGIPVPDPLAGKRAAPAAVTVTPTIINTHGDAEDLSRAIRQALQELKGVRVRSPIVARPLQRDTPGPTSDPVVQPTPPKS